jgi:flagellar protein FlgJ
MRVDPSVDAKNAAPEADGVRAQAGAAAEKFESYFIKQMLSQTRSATREMAGDEDALYKNRVNEDMQDFADAQVADAMSGQHAFGIADVILRQLLPQPAPAPGPAAPAATVRPAGS